MVSGIDEETPDSKVDPCGTCRESVTANSVLCTLYNVVSSSKMHDNEESFCLFG